MAFAGRFSIKLATLLWIMRGRVGRSPGAAADPEIGRAGIDKVGVILSLARHCGFSRYLELVTDVSGNFYRPIYQAGQFETRRLMYRCSWFQSDGLPIDYRSPSDDIAAPLAELRRDLYQPDICLVDPWHEYATSLRDIEAAFALVQEGGALIVHDCLPPGSEGAVPHYRPGIWSGWTHRAFIDFVWSTPGLTHFTVDCDYGCGVIFKLDRTEAAARLPAALLPAAAADREQVVAGWRALGDDPEGNFAYLHAHKATLLNLIPAPVFVGALAGESPWH